MSCKKRKKSLSNVTAWVGIWTALSVVTRLGKHLLVGPIQFINLPLLFAMLSGMLYGAEVGMGVGFLSFLVSDSFLGLGLWTIVDGGTAGMLGALWSRVKPKNKLFLVILAYLSTFLYDMLTSCTLYMIFGLSPMEAFIVGFLGLFIPVAGGGVFAIGPTTEAATAITLLFIADRLLRKNT